MSIYRKSVRPQNYVHAIEKTETLARPRLPSPMSVGVEEHKHLRKAAPANIALRRTLMWVASLPPTVRPTALVRRFAGIANLIAATWSDEKAFDTYMESLLTDKRGNRKGLPPHVVAELVALQRYRHTRPRRLGAI